MINVRAVGQEVAKNYRDEKARLQGKAISKARVLVTTPGDLINGPARPTHTAVRMMDGDPMVRFTDGSWRHATGKKPGKAARKALKRARRKQCQTK